MTTTAVKERPLIFSPAMAQAAHEGRKTMTRRIVKMSNSTIDGYTPNTRWWNDLDIEAATARDKATIMVALLGKSAAPEDVHLRAPHRHDGSFHRVRCRLEIGDHIFVREKCRPSEVPGTYWYAGVCGDEKHGRWKPSIHMPRAACRTVLEITDIRVERLQDISEDDAVAEGCTHRHCGSHFCGAGDSFFQVWERLHGKGAWDANPWVWVIAFKKCAVQP